MLKTTYLSYKYNESLVLSFPDLLLEDTDVLLVCGASGSGKTTLLHLLAGLLSPTTGEICLDEKITSNLGSSKMDQIRGKNMGIVFQKSYFIESLSILDNLLLSPYANNNKKAITIAKRLDILDTLQKKPHQLSVGQQQRIGIARAVINNPSLILADEPTSSLDDENCEKVLTLLLEESKINNAKLIIVTHDNRLKEKIKNCIELKLHK